MSEPPRKAPVGLRALAATHAQRDGETLYKLWRKSHKSNAYNVTGIEQKLKDFYIDLLDEFINESFGQAINQTINDVVHDHYNKIVADYHIQRKDNVSDADIGILATKNPLVLKLRNDV